MDIILGLAMIYSTVHFLIVQNGKTYKERTTWERVVTWVGIISITLVFLGVMTSEAYY